MKKFFTFVLSAALMLVALNASAQFRVEGGYLNANVKQTRDAVIFDVVGHGFYGGVGADLWLPVHGLSMDLGVFWDYETYKDFIAGLGIDAELHHVRIPLRFKYTYHFSDDFKVYAMAGPGVTYAVIGKARYKKGDKYVREDLFDDDDRRFDIQLGGEAGIRIFEHFSIKAGYDWGILNRGDDDAPARRNLLHAGVALEF